MREEIIRRIEALSGIGEDSLPTHGKNRPTRLGLIVQGGGMRGTYSAGVLDAIARQCGTASFDYMCGSSSGAINASYFLTNQTEDAIAGYCQDLSNKRFINLRRIHNVIDIDFLVDAVIGNSQRLDVEALGHNPITLEALLTRVPDAHGVWFNNRDHWRIWYEVLRATAALPIVYGKEVPVGHERFIDGGLVDPLPIRRAAEVGCTHALVVATVAPDKRRLGFRGVKRMMMSTLTRKLSAPIRDKLLNADTGYNTCMETLAPGHGLLDGTRFAVIRPSDWTRMASRLTNDRSQLEECAKLGQEDGLKFFES